MKLLEHFHKLSIYPKNAKQLKGLVLQLAMEGKLTKDWRLANPNLESVDLIIQDIGKERNKLIKEKKIRDFKKDEKANSLSEKIPTTWRSIKIGDLMDLINGKAFKPSDWSVSGLPIIRIQNLNKLDASFNYCDFEVKEKYYVNNGDILIGWSGTPGTSFGAFIWSRGKAVLNQHIFKAKLFSNLGNKNFVKLAINSQLDEMISQAHGGAGLKHITKGKFQNMYLPIPPLLEQEHIVVETKRIFQEVAQLEQLTQQRLQLKEKYVTVALNQVCKENTTQAWTDLKGQFSTFFNEEGNIKKLRETILELAVQGKLTANWRLANPDVEPAVDLLECIKAEKQELIKAKKIKKEKALPAIEADEIPYTLPDSWVWCRFGEVILNIKGGGTPSKRHPEYWNGNIPWASVKDLKQGKYLKYTQDFITKEGLENSSTNLIPQGQLIICTRMGLGKICFNDLPITINQDLKAIKLSRYIEENYVYNFYTSLNVVGTGVTVKGIKQSELLAFFVPVPPLQEQKAIVEKVNQLMTFCDTLEQEVIKSKEAAKKLMQVVLKEVFEENLEAVK